MVRTSFGGSGPMLSSSSGVTERHDVIVRHSGEDTKIGLIQGGFHEQTLINHVANIKRQNIRLDAAVIVARSRRLLEANAKVGKTPARDQNFRASNGQHAAHAVKRFTFDDHDIVGVYSRPGGSDIAALGLKMMLGLVTNVDPRANLSIDRVLENNRERLQQIEGIVKSDIRTLTTGGTIAWQLECRRRQFESFAIQSLRQHPKFGGDPNYQTMLDIYIDGLASAPAADDMPFRVVERVGWLFKE